MGNINMKWLVIGGIILVLLIAFGRNPADEAKKRYELSKKGKDPLMQAIEEYHSGDSQKGAFGRTRSPEWSPVFNRDNTPSYMIRNDPSYTPPQPQSPYQQPAAPVAPPSYY